MDIVTFSKVLANLLDSIHVFAQAEADFRRCQREHKEQAGEDSTGSGAPPPPPRGTVKLLQRWGASEVPSVVMATTHPPRPGHQTAIATFQSVVHCMDTLAEVEMRMFEVRLVGRQALCDELMPGFLATTQKIWACLTTRQPCPAKAISRLNRVIAMYLPMSQKWPDGLGGDLPTSVGPKRPLAGEAAVDCLVTLRGTTDPMTGPELAEKIDCSYGHLRKVLPRLLRDGYIGHGPAGYSLAEQGRVLIDRLKPT